MICSPRWFTNGITKGTSRSFLQGHRETGRLPVLDHWNSGERKQNCPNYRQTASDWSPSQRPWRGTVVAADLNSSSNFFSCKRHCLSFEDNLVKNYKRNSLVLGKLFFIWIKSVVNIFFFIEGGLFCLKFLK